MLTVAACFLFAAAASAGTAPSIPARFQAAPVGVQAYPEPPRSLDAAVAPAAVLERAAVAEPESLAEMMRWNAAANEPRQNGFSRSLGAPIHASFSGVSVASAVDARVWNGRVTVGGAYRLRLRLDHVNLPAGTILWVGGRGQKPIGFGLDLVDAEGGLWTPAAEGDTINLEVQLPANAAGAGTFDMTSVLELVGGIQPTDAPVCLVDASCVNDLQWGNGLDARSAVAQLQFVKDGGSYVCSGGLLNDKNSSGTPYLLTANHCFSTSSSASSLEAYWDYKTPNCNGSIPSFGALQRSVGAQLLATSATSDFTFVQLSSVPGNRTMLGWDASAQNGGMVLYRISFPFPDGAAQPFPASFSTTTLNTTRSTCTGRDRPNFRYSDQGRGGVYGGSSGSPVMTSDGAVLGQLLGSCGADPSAGCDVRNATVDGSFAVSYSSIQQWLQGGNPVTPTTCSPSTTNVCLVNNRFKVSMTYNGANMQATPFTGGNTGLFSQTSDPSNIEVLLKMIDACGFNAKFWVYSGGTTDQGIAITVVDTKTGTTKTYTNPKSTKFQTITDASAFNCP
ncbi:MAG TPA: trypsin-like peptidase domain-containing protein [Thermoanaerobaculia bacterium]|nr:trypsin-like peptidase domain-containing protein [Thermoanaerobaculia bacterium]